MRPDLIGERCTAVGYKGQLVQWVHGDESYGLILLDDGTMRFVDVEHMRFPPRTEQPDELRLAAESLLAMCEAAHAGQDFASDGVVVDAMTRLRKALDQ